MGQRRVARSSRTNAQWSELIVSEKTHKHRGIGHFEVREVVMEKKSCQLGLANCRGLWFVVGSSQIELSASLCSIALLRKRCCVLLVYLGQGKLKIPVGIKKYKYIDIFCREGTNVHKD